MLELKILLIAVRILYSCLQWSDRRTGRFNLMVRIPDNHLIEACASPSTV